MKRTLDLVVAASALVLLAPILGILALLVRQEDGGPALFRQTRIGRDGRPFQILKFRTMRSGSKGLPLTRAADPRITRIGAALRRWKLDELPQLWNVLRGEMSLVGPRPEVPDYVALYSPEMREVLQVRPGLTGPAQLDGFDEEEALARASDPERFYREVLLPRKVRIDLEYVRRPGLAADVRVLWRTARRLLLSDGGNTHAATE